MALVGLMVCEPHLSFDALLLCPNEARVGEVLSLHMKLRTCECRLVYSKPLGL